MPESLDLRRYVTCPLSSADLLRLETSTGKAIPPGVRAFLSQVGFPQNVVPAIFQDENAFVGAQQYAQKSTFVFAEPGESLLGETPDGVIVEIDAPEERVAFSRFGDFLKEYASDPRDEPDEICWAIQLSFSTSSEHAVRESLADLLRATFASQWVREGISSAGVTTYSAQAHTPGCPPLTRLEYGGWKTPILFLYQRVSRPQFVAFKGYIRCWHQSELGFGLVNYGLLPRDL